MFNQSQVRDLVFETIAEAKLRPASGKVAFIRELGQWFAGLPSSDPADDESVILSSDGTKWVAVGGADRIKGEWDSSTTYNEGELIWHLGHWYYVNETVSNIPPDDVISKYTRISHVPTVSDWDVAEANGPGDIVKKDGRLWILNIAKAPTVSFELRDPVLLQSDIWRMTDYSNTIEYYENDVINYQGKYYRSLVDDNTNNTPDTNTDKWEQVLAEQTEPKPYDLLPVKTGEIRKGLHGYLLIAQRDIPVNGDLTETYPHETDYAVYRIGEVIPYSEENYWLEGYRIGGAHGSVWKVNTSGIKPANIVSVCSSIKSFDTVVDWDTPLRVTPGGNLGIPAGSFYTYKGGLYRMEQDVNWTNSMTEPLGASNKATFIKWNATDHILEGTKAVDMTTETAQTGTFYISPEQHGGIYGTVYRRYFGQQTNDIQTVLSGWTDVEVLDAKFRVSVWLSDSRGTGAADFIEVTSGNNWPKDAKFRVRVLQENTTEFKIQQGANMRIESGWVDFVGSNSNMAELEKLTLGS